jgi:parvulin-like peptidyl-prolyl isomerase
MKLLLALTMLLPAAAQAAATPPSLSPTAAPVAATVTASAQPISGAAAASISPTATPQWHPSASAQTYQKIVAKVGSDIITSYDVENAIKILESSLSPGEAETPEGQKKLADAKAKVVDQMIEQKLVVLAAEKGPEGYKEAADKGTAPANPYLPSNLEIEEELDKEFDQARNRFAGQSEFEEELKRERISLSEFRARLRENLRAQMTFQRMVKAKEQEFRPNLRVSDEESKAFYEEHKDAFSVGAQVLLRHILYAAKDLGAAKAAAMALKSSAHLKDDFILRAKKDSKDELTADKGGRLGWIEKGGLRWKEVEDKAFKMRVDELAGPIKSSEGWHLIYVEEKKDGEQKSYDEVKAQARNAVYQEKVQKRIEAWVEDLKRQFFVERDDG